MNTPFWRVMLAIVRKDLQAELRSRELVGTMLMFTVLSILIFSMALELNRNAREEAISGVLWVTLIFASILGLNRSMGMERDNGNMDAMLIAPVNRAAIFAGKFLGNLFFTLIVGVAMLPILTILFNVTILSFWTLVIMLLGVVGFAGTGTLLSAITVQTRSRDALLPIVQLPIAIPLLLATIRATTANISNVEFEQWNSWLYILALIDLVYLVISTIVFDYVIEE